MEAKQTPLIELLERVPQDARVVVEHDQFSSSSHPVGRLCHEAAAALRAALAQEQAEPVQEPVAWMLTDADNQRVKFLEWQKETRGYSGAWIKTPLYTAPPRCPNCASLEAQNDELDRKLAEMERAEPAAVVGTQVDVWRGCDGRWAPPGGPIKTALMLKDMPVGTMLYATPPKRQPLTEEEIKDCFHDARNAKLGASKDNSKHRLSVVEIARAIEQAHGIIEPRIEEDSHQTLDDAMQQPRAMAQAYESGYNAGVANEREACAKVCESRFMGDLTREDMEARRCAAAIRARGEMP